MNTEGLTTKQWAKVKARMREYFLTIQGQEFLSVTIRDPESYFFGHGLQTPPEDIWCEQMFSFYNAFEFSTAFLLLLLPNVETITQFNSGFVDELMICKILSAAGKTKCKPNSAPEYSFGSLKVLNTHLSRDFTEGQPLDQITTMLGLCSLETLSCKTISKGDNLPLTPVEAVSDVRHLELLSCSFSPKALKHILFATQSLRTLKFSYGRRYSQHQSETMFPDLINNLHHLADCLESLAALDEEELALKGVLRQVVFPPLTEFRKLRQLEIQGRFLDFVIRDQTSQKWELSPFDFANFPPNLEQLVLRSVDRRYMMSHLASNLERLELVVKPKRIHLEIFKTDFSGWRDWPYIAWRYRENGIILSFSFCPDRHLSWLPAKVFEFTRSYCEGSYLSYKDDTRRWSEGEEDEDKILALFDS